MIFIHGSRLYSRIDEVPNVFYISTHFVHAQFLPIIPRATYLVLRPEAAALGKTPAGIRIPLSGRSILAAYIFAFSVLAIPIALIALPICIRYATDPAMKYAHQSAAIGAASCAAALVASGLGIWYTRIKRSTRRATYERALFLAEQAKLPEPIRLLIDVQFGKVTTEEARELFAALEELPPSDAPTHEASGR